MLFRFRLCLLLIALCCLSTSTRADIVAPVASLGGPIVQDVAMVAGHVLVADLLGVSIYDPTTNQGAIARLEGSYRYIHVLGSHVWVGNLGNYDAYDLSDPTNPAFVGSLSLAPPYEGVYDPSTQRYYSVGQAYPASNVLDLLIYDVSSITGPVLIGELPAAIETYPGYHLWLTGLAIEQNRLYVSYSDLHDTQYGQEGEMNMRIFQVADPTDITLIDDFQLTSYSGGGFGVCFDADSDLLLINVTDAGSPGESFFFAYDVDDLSGATMLGSFPQDLLFGLRLKGVDEIDYDPLTQVAHLWGSRYVELDVSDPTSITMLCDVDWVPGSATATDGSYFVTNQIGELNVYQPSCTSIQFQRQILHGYQQSGMTRMGNLIIVGQNPASVLDPTIPTAPVFLSKFDAYGTSPKFTQLQTLDGTHLVQTNRYDLELRIFDLSDPVQPSGTIFSMPGAMWTKFGITGTTLGYLRYDFGVETSLQLVDLSDPTAPDLRSSYTRSWADWDVTQTTSVVMQSDTAYIAVLDEIWVIDVGNLHSPKLKTTLPASSLGASAAIELQIANGLLFSSDTTDPRIWSLADPQNPLQLATLPVSGAPNTFLSQVAFLGDVAYFWYGDTLFAYDLADPSAPQEVGSQGPQSNTTNTRHLVAANAHLVGYLDGKLEILTPISVTATPPAGRASNLQLCSAPSPFRGRTQISWSPNLRGAGELRVFDVAGRLVRRWRIGDLHSQSLQWDGVNQGGHRVASGVYYLRLEAGGQQASRRVIFER